MPKEEYIQIGVTALREPGTGEFLPAVPLYIKAEDTSKVEKERLTQDIVRLFAGRMRKYKEACAAAGVPSGV